MSQSVKATETSPSKPAVTTTTVTPEPPKDTGKSDPPKSDPTPPPPKSDPAPPPPKSDPAPPAGATTITSTVGKAAPSAQPDPAESDDTKRAPPTQTDDGKDKPAPPPPAVKTTTITPTSAPQQTTFETSKRISTSTVTADAKTSSSSGTVAPYTKTTTVAAGTNSVSQAAPTPTADQQQCDDVKNQRSFKVQSSVIKGNQTFDGIWVEQPPFTSGTTFPTLSKNAANAASIVFNPSAMTLAASHGDCKFTGFSMIPTSAQNQNPYSDTAFSQDLDKAKMSTDNNKVAWADARFGSWLVCNSGGVAQLKYWDASSQNQVDMARCAQVGLQAVST
ncbi:hypothetical protein B0A55_09616 [Friedmanniomyces simplex]|uniref:DUF7907 domain-containing protein n=1 Tax=Friedmanniomyces simplex TaxID=329884 RepID=A0A4U0WS59_9PEZI|nr:hypothetical protein B0A55_09616 [Friedmanniomyces simplex]